MDERLLQDLYTWLARAKFDNAGEEATAAMFGHRLKEALETPEAHPDDLAIDRFAVAMKARMAEMRAHGRSGWDDPSKCSVDYLQRLLQASCISEPIDVGNYAMMVFNRTTET